MKLTNVQVLGLLDIVLHTYNHALLSPQREDCMLRTALKANRSRLKDYWQCQIAMQRLQLLNQTDSYGFIVGPKEPIRSC